MMYETYNKPSHISYDRLDRAIVHACQYLGLDDIFIEITFESLGITAGNCDVVDGVAEISLNRSLRGKTLELTIFHEFVHIKQILDGKLIIGEGLTPSKWCDIIYTCSYDKLPWEIEAYRLEKEMMECFNGLNTVSG